MKIKSFTPKNKVICGILALFFAVIFLYSKQSVMAVSDGEDDVAVVRPVPVSTEVKNPFVNVAGEGGWTLLMCAIREHDPEFVKLLLQQGADLNIMPSEISSNYSNAFEYLCDLVIRVGSGIVVDGEYENKTWLVSEDVCQSYYDTVDIILRHCVEYEMPLSVDMSKLRDHSEEIDTVWDCYAKWYYWEKMYEYPHLFK